MVIFLLLLTAAVGGVMVFAGLRGRRVDDRPLCRTCRFDLSGLELAQANCPECGVRLQDDRIVWGNRVRRRSLIVLGVVLLLPPVGSVALLFTRPSSVLALLPDRPLVWLAGASGGPHALAEVRGRLQRGTLGRDDALLLVHEALRRQSATGTPWREGWGDLVDGAIGLGWVEPVDIERFLRQAVALDVSMSERAAAGMVPWHDFRLASPGTKDVFAHAGNISIDYWFDVEAAAVDGEPWPLRTSSVFMPVKRTYSLSATRIASSYRIGDGDARSDLGPIEVEPGMHEVAMVVAVSARHPSDPAGTVYTWRVPIEKQIEVRARGESLVDLVTDAAALRTLRERISVRVHNEGGETGFAPRVDVRVRSANLNVSARVRLYVEGQEWSASDRQALSFYADAPGGPVLEPEFAARFVPAPGGVQVRGVSGRVRVVLEPWPEEAMPAGMLDIAGEAMVFDDVAVEPATASR